MSSINKDAHITISLARAQRAIASLQNSSGTNHELAISGFDAKHGITKAQRDFEVFAEILKSRPAEATEVVEHVIAGRMAPAHAIAEKIGLTEANLQARGGELAWIVIAVAIGCLFLEHD